MVMDSTSIYAIVAGSAFLGLVVVRAIRMLYPWKSLFEVLIYRHLVYPYVLRRHPLIGPWSRAIILFNAVYLAVNLVIIFLKGTSLAIIGGRAGSLCLINLIIPFSAGHLSHLADLLGVSLRNVRRIHRASGWMCLILILIHIGAFLFDQRTKVLKHDNYGLFTIIGGGSLGLLLLLSLPIVRKLSYEVFLRVHQALSILVFYAIWQHVPTELYFPRLYIYIALGILTTTSILQLISFAYRNGLFSRNGSPRALVTCKSAGTTQSASIKIRLTVPTPVKVMAGQYINIWLPSVSLWSWAQTHPFIITSWAHGKQGVMELLIHPRQGQSASLFRQMRVVETEACLSLLALYSGPHGISEPVSNYENVILVASGSGLAAVIPYITMLIHGYNTCTMHVRRIHLIWQVQELDFAISTQELLNSLLADDVLDNGYILTISIYVEHGPLKRDKLPFGRHERAVLYQGVPDYHTIVSSEASGETIERVPTLRDEKGQMLLMASTSGLVRDQLREVVRQHLNEHVNMVELEYQP